MSDQQLQVLRELVLHEAHTVAERTRDRLRNLQRRYPFPKRTVEELHEAGIEVTDAGADRDTPPS
jgi:hypothetical protein